MTACRELWRGEPASIGSPGMPAAGKRFKKRIYKPAINGEKSSMEVNWAEGSGGSCELDFDR